MRGIEKRIGGRVHTYYEALERVRAFERRGNIISRARVERANTRALPSSVALQSARRGSYRFTRVTSHSFSLSHDSLTLLLIQPGKLLPAYRLVVRSSQADIAPMLVLSTAYFPLLSFSLSLSLSLSLPDSLPLFAFSP